MNDPRPHSSGRGTSELRVGLVAAALLIALPLAARLGAPLPHDLADRGWALISAAFLVMTGNSIPKRLAPWVGGGADAARVQAFQRFVGWVWVLAGIVWGTACALVPAARVPLATLVILPTAMLMIAARTLALRGAARPHE